MDSSVSAADESNVNQAKSLESIKVLVRVRPLSDKELSENNVNVVDIGDDRSLKVTSADGKKSFQCEFDAVVGPATSQAQVYDIVRGCTKSVLDGFNSTIFAYGQTGSGKTYSMYGPPTSSSGAGRSSAPRETEYMGLIPRAVNEIFEISKSKDILDFTVYCSFVQIYNENLFDMLRDSSMVSPLSIREDKKEMYVQGLSEYQVQSVADTLQLLKIAEENRAIRETHMNQFSSRSHSIFQIYVEQKRVAEDGGEISYRAKFNLVDLAGSEKWNSKVHMRDAHIAEMTNINLSLHTLGKCISALAQQSILRDKEAQRERENANRSANSVDRNSNNSSSSASQSEKGGTSSAATPGKFAPRPGTVGTGSSAIHVPYRDSKLTRLLQDSLGGNAKTFLIATISPARANAEESISTLKFADRAKQVMVQAVINETRPVDHALVKRLQAEVETLKGMLKRLMEHNNNNAAALAAAGGGVSDGIGTGAGVGTTAPAVGHFSVSASYSKLNFSDLPTTSTSTSSTQQQTQPQHGGRSPDFLTTNKTSAATANATSTTTTNAGSNLAQQLSALERALNKEQTQSAHLAQKNETLIKELEELKSRHFQLIRHQDLLIQQQQQQGGSTAGGNTNSPQQTPSQRPVQVVTALPPNTATITHSEAASLLDTVSSLTAQNSALFDQLESLQTVMKLFFRYDIEEGDMKERCTAVFSKLKELKSIRSTQKPEVDSSVSVLEHIARKSGTAIATTGGASQSASAGSSYPVGDMQYYQPPVQLPAIPNQQQHLGSQSVAGGNRTLSHNQSLPVISTAPAGSVKPMMSGGDRSQYQQQYFTENNNNSNHNTSHDTSQMHRSQSQQITGSNNGNLNHNNNSNKSGGLNTLAFRVRGASTGPPNITTLSTAHHGQPSGPPTSGSVRSSTGNWITTTPAEDEAAEEQRLEREVKKAKKKAKREQKLKEWAKEKEDKMNAELRLQEEEKKAMREAEALREEKRREYANKQKDKLASYQQKVKSEAEKIQEMLDLGIDPKSLNYY